LAAECYFQQKGVIINRFSATKHGAVREWGDDERPRGDVGKNSTVRGLWGEIMCEPVRSRSGSARWAKLNLDLADLSPEHAYWTGGISQVGLRLIPIPHTPSAWLTRCRSPAGPRWPETKGAAAQELRRDGLLAGWCAPSRRSICPLQRRGVARSSNRGLPSIPTTRGHEKIFDLSAGLGR
jgi:hypothetical protein